MALREAVIGLIQLEASPSKSVSLERLRGLAGRVREATIIAMPEYAMLDPTDTPLERLRSEAESVEEPGPWLREAERLASEHSACVVATFFEPAPDGRVYNSAAVIRPSGGVAGVYRKTHLFDAYGYRESAKIAPGESVFEPVDACGVRLGLAICFEIRVPELARAQALAGAELIVYPAAWYSGPLKEETLHTLARARAHENTVYVAVAALAGPRFTGRSTLVDPLGVQVAEAGPWPGYVEAPLEPWRLERARSVLPILQLLRLDLPGLGVRR
ncbi:MAG: carbon-nitrogen hydrolase family protein [Desulfurococcales archaeon]|nr:carbon-nitrogen hydrolase family protein [Desulfurococcales archaeon]